MWDQDTCECSCRHVATCAPGHRWDPASCACLRLAAADSCYHAHGGHASLTTYKVGDISTIIIPTLTVTVDKAFSWLKAPTSAFTFKTLC